MLVILRVKLHMPVSPLSDRFAISVEQKAEFMLYAAANSFFIPQINKHCNVSIIFFQNVLQFTYFKIDH